MQKPLSARTRATRTWKAHEAPLARELTGWVEPGEVLPADRAFCSWGLLALFQRKGVDVVVRLHQARKTRLGLVHWPKPQRQGRWGKSLWAELPETLTLRVVRFRVAVPGFRIEAITLVTTLLDAVAYPDAAVAELFHRRWQVELCFRDLKTTLGLDVLRTRTPAMIEKEIHLQVIAYNLVRALMLEAARQHDVPPDRLSFQGTISTLRSLAADRVPSRPNRVEPRAQTPS